MSPGRRLLCTSLPLFLVITFIFIARPAASRTEDESKGERVDQIFGAFDKVGSPGCALGVVRDGELIYKRGYGLASLELGVEIDSRTVFYVGSVSKQFVAASVALASKQGHLGFDDDIRVHLPEIRNYGSPITIRYLLHHTSGIRDYLTLMSLAGVPVQNVARQEDVLALIARQKELNFEPGSEYLYSNSGYFLLAQIVGRATGKSLREFADLNIFEPLGMRDTHFHDNRRHVIKNRAAAYVPGLDGGFQVGWSLAFDQVGSGGLMTTVEDLLLWDQSFYRDTLGEGELWKQMLTRGSLTSGETLDYAFGLNLGEYQAQPTIRHGGSLMGYRAELLRFPEQSFSIICLCNVASANPRRLTNQVSQVFLEDVLPEQVVPNPGAEHVSVPRSAAPEVTDVEQLREFVGEYFSEELEVTYELYLADGELFNQIPLNDPAPVHVGADDTLGVGRIEATVERDERGAILGFRVQADRVRNLWFKRK